MAIIQISKIQQRSGNLVDLPQLDEAQFGWATDAKRLFIGKTTPNENIEVLTSYSNISFSQIDGSGGSNINITANALQNGQLLTYVATTHTWENYTGNSSQIGNSKLQLGNVANIKMSGGSTGFVLQTDGLGNLSWTPKTTIVANIVALSNATPVVMTVANVTPYTNGSQVTISGANGVSNANINSHNFYIKLASNFPSSGNVELYANADFTGPLNGTGLTYTNSPNALAITTVGGTSTLVAAGANTSIQFNNSGTLQGSPYFTILNGNGLLTHTGPYFAVGNVYANSGAVVASQLTGSLMTNAQPNVTSVGTLTSVSVSGNANVGNLNTAGTVTASIVAANNNGNGTNFKVGDDAWIGDININNTMVVKGQQDATKGYIIFGNGDTTSQLGRSGTGPLTYLGAFSVTGNANVGNIGAAAGVFTTVTGSLTTAAQPNITSTGTLASLSVSGNANIGNIGTAGLITATGNISGANIVGTHYGAATGLTSIPGANVTGAVAYATTANSVAGANVSGAVSYATTANAVAGANVSGAVNLATYATTANSVAGGNVSGAVAFATTANSVAGANVSGTVANATYATSAGSASTAGTVTTAAQPNITSTGTLASLTVSANVATGGIKTDNYYYANGVSISFAGSYSNSNVAAYLPTFTGTVGAGTATHYGTTLTTGANTTAGTITGNWSLSAGSKLNSTYADLAEYYEADSEYEPGTVLAFGGEKEVTIAEVGTTRVAGVVSTNPAYAMNATCTGIAVAIALQGRVPTKVRGTIRKGDMMISAGNGYARPSIAPQMGTVIGKALENFEGIEGVIEIAIGRL